MGKVWFRRSEVNQKKFEEAIKNRDANKMYKMVQDRLYYLREDLAECFGEDDPEYSATLSAIEDAESVWDKIKNLRALLDQLKGVSETLAEDISAERSDGSVGFCVAAPSDVETFQEYLDWVKENPVKWNGNE